VLSLAMDLESDVATVALDVLEREPLAALAGPGAPNVVELREPQRAPLATASDGDVHVRIGGPEHQVHVSERVLGRLRQERVVWILMILFADIEPRRDEVAMLPVDGQHHALEELAQHLSHAPAIAARTIRIRREELPRGIR
jgi:hypothetical protein